MRLYEILQEDLQHSQVNLLEVEPSGQAGEGNVLMFASYRGWYMMILHCKFGPVLETARQEDTKAKDQLVEM